MKLVQISQNSAYINLDHVVTVTPTPGTEGHTHIYTSDSDEPYYITWELAQVIYALIQTNKLLTSGEYACISFDTWGKILGGELSHAG